MKERKILTLEEVINLDRQPTLQEMLDLSMEDYTKYLYHRKVIKYIPENYDLHNYKSANYWDYDVENDMVVLLKNPEYDYFFDESITEEELIEIDNDLIKENVEKAQEDLLNETLTIEEYNKIFAQNEEEKGYIFIKDKKHEYHIDNMGGLTIFTKNPDGSKNIVDTGGIFYLE
jgi:hypothetical protein